MKFGSVLREARIGSGMSQEELALQMFMPRSTISKLENNKMVLKMADFIKWLQVTQLHDVAAATTAVVSGVDLVTLTQTLTSLVGGFLRFI